MLKNEIDCRKNISKRSKDVHEISQHSLLHYNMQGNDIRKVLQDSVIWLKFSNCYQGDKVPQYMKFC